MATGREVNDNNLSEQMRRRRRINKIKKIILGIIASYFLISVIVITALSIRIHQLNVALKDMQDGIPKAEQVQNEDDKKETKSQTQTSQVDEKTLEELKEELAMAQKANLAQEGDTHKVYLTFDDGPSENTSRILNVLKVYGVKATFFVTGKEGEEYEELYKRIVEEGHTLAMHSYSHMYSTIYESTEAFETDYNKLYNYLKEVTGVECKFYRFPGGSSNQVSNCNMIDFVQYVKNKGITYFDWNVSSGDATSQAYTADEIANNVVSDVQKYKTSVVLLHDAEDKDTTVDALSSMIEQLQEMGAEILPIDETTTAIQHVNIGMRQE